MLNGSSQVIQVSSQIVYDSLMATVNVPATVAEQKKNKAAAVSSFISQVKKLDPQIKSPSTETGCILRDSIKAAVTTIGKEYKTHAYPEFVAALTIEILAGTSQRQKIMTQLHRFLLCSGPQNINDFADHCAIGKAAPIDIDFTLHTSHLPGFQLLLESTIELVPLAGYLLDYACFMSNSDIQALYATTKQALLSVSLSTYGSVQEFADAELEYFSQHQVAATAAQRSVIDSIDRGLSILSKLPLSIKDKINKLARKDHIPENCQDRDWSIKQLLVLEEFKDPDFSWYKQNSKSKQICRHFLAGSCTFPDCRFSHDISTKPGASPQQQSQQPPPTSATQQPASNQSALPAADSNSQASVDPGSAAPGAVMVSCRARSTPDCAVNFHTSPSYWSNKTTADDKPLQTPKSCAACRKFNKGRSGTQQPPPTTSSMLTADDTECSLVAAALATGVADPGGDHPNDFDEDYYIANYSTFDPIADYAIAMSDVST